MSRMQTTITDKQTEQLRMLFQGGMKNTFKTSMIEVAEEVTGLTERVIKVNDCPIVLF